MSIKMKNFKTFYQDETAIRLKEIIQPAHQLKAFYVSGDIQEYTDICFPSDSRMQFLDV